MKSSPESVLGGLRVALAVAVGTMAVFYALLCGWERACESGGEYPHSGFCPDAPSWEGGMR